MLVLRAVFVGEALRVAALKDAHEWRIALTRDETTGAGGPLEFDLSVGNAYADIDVGCYSESSDGYQPSGQGYSELAGTLSGAFDDCD